MPKGVEHSLGSAENAKPWRVTPSWMPKKSSTLMNGAIVVGSAQTGLVGPFAFPDRYSFERRKELDKCGRKRARRLQSANGSFHGVPLYVEAVVPPLKALRHLLAQLAAIVGIHTDDIGHAMLASFFPDADGAACIDFTSDVMIESCLRAGTRGWLSRWRRWFWINYAELQVHALESGRYFPPPQRLRVHVPVDAPLYVEIAYAKGYLPGDRRYVRIAATAGAKSLGYLLAHDEPPPRLEAPDGFLLQCARRVARPGERVLSVHRAWLGESVTSLGVKEGDALRAATISRGYVSMRWQGHHLFRVHAGELRHRQAFPIRVVRLDYNARNFTGRLAYAVYGPDNEKPRRDVENLP